MPRKIRQLLADYRKAGFVINPGGGKGSHRHISHPEISSVTFLSGNDGDDAHHYQEKNLKRMLSLLRSKQ